MTAKKILLFVDKKYRQAEQKTPIDFLIRDRPRFFDQVGHQTTNVSIGNKSFFTK